MPSGVAVEPGVPDLYLSGAKAQILITNQRPDSAQLHTEFTSYTVAEPHQQQSVHKANGAYRLHFGRDVSCPKTFRTENTQVKDRGCDNGSLPNVNSSQKALSVSGHCSVSSRPADKTAPHVNDGQYLSQVTSFPPARNSAYLVTNDIDTNSNHSGKTGKVSCGPADTEGVEKEDGRCPTDQAEGQWSGHPTQTSAASSCSRSNKENRSPKPPETKKKKVKQKQRKLKKSLSRRNSVIKKAVMRQNLAKPSPGLPSTAPATSSTQNRTLRLSCAPVMIYTKKPMTAHSVPEIATSSLKQRQDASRGVYNRQGGQSCVMPSRSRTLPSVESCVSSRYINSDLPRQSTSMNSTSANQSSNVLHSSKQLARLSDSPTQTRSSSAAAQYWGRLVNVYLSEKHSGSLKDKESGTEYPCAPPATPTPDQLQKYRYIPSMNDVKSQRAVKNKLQALEKAEQKRQEKQHGKKAKAEQQVLKENEKVLKHRQRQEIYALNAVMTELEYNRFVLFCLSNNIQPS
ncbi:uncharacterized protein LOC135475859 [Liolophura sinensis]|uniref:uncharacterized protein LOC135475859 n=1 Tax=Liolophura sinensis TaxID=3198878 RepID=UPI00315892F7